MEDKIIYKELSYKIVGLAIQNKKIGSKPGFWLASVIKGEKL